MRASVILAFAALLLSTIGNAANVVPVVLTGKAEVLQGAEALAVFDQCSRWAPRPTQVLSAPTADEIQRLEAAVEQRASAEHESNQHSTFVKTPYGRQYVAYLADGNRKIYGNYFSASLLKEFEKEGFKKGRAVAVCDGGAAFWGAVFDPMSGKIESLEFNGVA